MWDAMIGSEELVDISGYQMLSADKKNENLLTKHEAREKKCKILRLMLIGIDNNY